MEDPKCGEDADVLYLTFVMRGWELDPRTVTSRLRVEPDWRAKRGEPLELPGRKFNPDQLSTFGLWALSTRGKVVGNVWSEHAGFLLDKVEPSKKAITDYLRDESIAVVVRFCYDVAEGDVCSADLPSDQLAKLSSLCNHFAISVVFRET